MAKTWEYRGCVIEEDFESWSNSTPGRMLTRRTGYIIRAKNYTDKNDGPYVPGKYRTLAEAKRGVDYEMQEGGWLCESTAKTA